MILPRIGSAWLKFLQTCREIGGRYSSSHPPPEARTFFKIVLSFCVTQKFPFVQQDEDPRSPPSFDQITAFIEKKTTPPPDSLARTETFSPRNGFSSRRCCLLFSRSLVWSLTPNSSPFSGDFPLAQQIPYRRIPPLLSLNCVFLRRSASVGAVRTQGGPSWERSIFSCCRRIFFLGEQNPGVPPPSGLALLPKRFLLSWSRGHPDPPRNPYYTGSRTFDYDRHRTHPVKPGGSLFFLFSLLPFPVVRALPPSISL